MGTVIAGRYKLLRVLGAGGMGAVYEAEQIALGRRVAIKVMLGEDALDATSVARFVREARAASRIAHPNIVTVLDADHDAQAHTPYIAQELLRGVDLRAHLADRGRLSSREALALLLPILDALDAAHRAGIIHRDLKPENIFLVAADDGRTVPKLIDFGVSKLLDAQGPGVALTRTGGLVGTPRYMPPEQARGLREVDASADVWSLGVVLFEALAGRCPFVADNYNAQMVEILTAEIPSAATFAPETPAWLEAVVAQMLVRDRERRLSSAGAVLRALRSASEGGAAPWLTELLGRCATPVAPSTTEPVLPPPAAPDARASLLVADTLPSDQPPPRASTPAPPAPSRAARLGLGAVALALVGVAIASWTSSPRTSAAPRAAVRPAPPTPPPVAASTPPAATPPAATPPVAPPAPVVVPFASPRAVETPRAVVRARAAAPRATDGGALPTRVRVPVAAPTTPHVVAPVTDPEHMQ